MHVATAGDEQQQIEQHLPCQAVETIEDDNLELNGKLHLVLKFMISNDIR